MVFTSNKNVSALITTFSKVNIIHNFELSASTKQQHNLHLSIIFQISYLMLTKPRKKLIYLIPKVMRNFTFTSTYIVHYCNLDQFAVIKIHLILPDPTLTLTILDPTKPRSCKRSGTLFKSLLF